MVSLIAWAHLTEDRVSSPNCVFSTNWSSMDLILVSVKKGLTLPI